MVPLQGVRAAAYAMTDAPTAVTEDEQTSEFFEAALAETERRPAMSSAEAERARVMKSALGEHLGDAYARAGRGAAARVAYGRALEQTADDDTRRARLLRKTGNSFYAEADDANARDAYARASAALGNAPPEPSQLVEWREEWVQLRIDEVSLCDRQGRQADRTALVRDLEPILIEHGTPRQRLQFFRGRLQWGLRAERYALSSETVGHGLDALAAALSSGSPTAIPMAHFNYGFALLLHGDFEDAEHQLSVGLSLAEQGHDAALVARCLAYLTVVSRERFRVEEVRDRTARSLRAAEEAKLRDYARIAHANEAWLALDDGRFTLAEARAREALDGWRRSSLAFPLQWLALVPLAEVLLASGRLGGAVDCATALLGPHQARLPDDITASLATAIERFRVGDEGATRRNLEAALEMLRGRSHLSQD